MTVEKSAVRVLYLQGSDHDDCVGRLDWGADGSAWGGHTPEEKGLKEASAYNARTMVVCVSPDGTHTVRVLSGWIHPDRMKETNGTGVDDLRGSSILYDQGRLQQPP
jgi:hypothetical protein